MKLLSSTLLLASLTGVAIAQEPPPVEAPAPPPVRPEDPPIPADTDIVTLPSGLAYSILTPATDGAEKPAMGDVIEVHYTGWTTDGKSFDSSRKPRFAGGPVEPAKFALGEVIEGWNEGMQYCPVGGRLKLTIPGKLAYGPKGIPQAGIGPDATLVFDVELIAIEKRALAPVEWPTDPAKVQKSESGLEWCVIEPGEGEPLTKCIGIAEYTARNTGGGWIGGSNYSNPRSMFNGPLVIGVGNSRFRFVSEAQQHLKPGAHVLFRVPPDLAFGNRELPNLPAGSPSLWQVKVVSALDSTKPEFTLPPDTELTATATGLKYKVLREGTGKLPKATSTVLAHYAGWLTDGKQFDASWDNGAPISFSLQEVVAGWTEGLQLVREGGRILLVIPPQIGYGAGGRGSIPPNATMVFIIDLVTAS